MAGGFFVFVTQSSVLGSSTRIRVIHTTTYVRRGWDSNILTNERERERETERERERERIIIVADVAVVKIKCNYKSVTTRYQMSDFRKLKSINQSIAMHTNT